MADGVVRVSGFDHLVLRCRDVDVTLAWYQDVLGLDGVRVEEWRAGAAPFPSVRIDAGTIVDLVPALDDPTGEGPAPIGHLDHLCLVADRASVEAIAADADGYGVIDGPDERYGARGIGMSVYLRDPDGTTVEIRHYDR